MINRRWEVRTHTRVTDSTRVRSALVAAAKEFNTDGQVITEPQDWCRRVGYWVD